MKKHLFQIVQYMAKYGLFHTGCYADHKEMRKEVSIFEILMYNIFGTNYSVASVTIVETQK